MKRRALLLAALGSGALGTRAQQDHSIGAALNDLVVRVERDVPYGPDRRHRFDAYLPGTVGGPLLLFVHGGAWAAGDKRSRSILANVRHWTARGFVVVSTNYRLLPRAHPLEQARDVALALGQAQQRAPGWGADSTAVVLMGHSSGAHLAALLTAEPALGREQGADPWRGTVCLDNPAFDVPGLMAARHASLYDRAFGTNQGYWRTVSPLHVLARDARPLLAVCSTRGQAACAQAHAFAERATRGGMKVQVQPVDLRHLDVQRQLGLPGAYSESVERWMSSIL
jgi:arylformamidase